MIKKIIVKKNKLAAVFASAIAATTVAVAVPAIVISTQIKDSSKITNSTIESFHDNLSNITLDNFGEWFTDVNNFDGANNSGKLDKETLSKLFNNKLPSHAFESVKIETIENNPGPMLNLNIEITLNEPFKYHDESVIKLSNVKTGIYDPNSRYNQDLFKWDETDENAIIGFNVEKVKNSLEITKNKIYLPKKCVTFKPAVDSMSELTNIEEFIGDYATDLEKLDKNLLFRGASLKKITFRNLPKFVGSNSYFNWIVNSSVEEIVFEDCSEFVISNNQTQFGNCTNLKKLSFKGSKTQRLPNKFIDGCPNLEVLDLRDTQIQPLAISETAFNGIKQNKIKILVNNEEIKTKIIEVLTGSGFENPESIVVME